MSPLFADELVMGMVELPMSKYDRFIVNEVRNHLMENSGLEHSGIDLAAVNIQRGRDHGLRSFVDYESYCSKDILQRLNTNPDSSSSYTKIRDFQDLQIRNFDDETIEKLKEVYKNVEDIDFFTGGLSEKSLPDGLVGNNHLFLVCSSVNQYFQDFLKFTFFSSIQSCQQLFIAYNRNIFTILKFFPFFLFCR